MSDPIQIEVFTDLVCPWCYVGEARLEQAIRDGGFGDQVEIVTRSFELDPDAPADAEPVVDQLMRKFHRERGDVEQMEAQIQQLAATEQLPWTSERLTGNTFDVHRLTHLATEHGVRERFFKDAQRAYFAGTVNPFDREQLLALAEGVGVPRAEAAAVLDDPDAFADEVRADERRARALGAQGVPFFVIDQRFGVSGAQPAEVLRGGIAQALAERQA